MANLTTAADLMEDILFRSGENTDGTSDYDSQALVWLNRAYRIVALGGGEFDPELNEDWWWLKKDPPGVLNLQPIINAGSVSVTNNSVNIVFSSPPAISVAGWFLKTGQHSDVFRIATHTAAAAAATLDAGYTGVTAVAADFRLMKMEYALAADLMKITAPMRVQAGGKAFIDGLELDSLERGWPLTNFEHGIPGKFAMAGEQKVRFNRGGMDDPGEYIRVEYDYIYLPDALTNSSGSIPAVPLQYRHVLSDIALFYIWTIKNDDRTDGIGMQARNVLRQMKKENRRRMVAYSRTFGQLYARPANRSRTVLRTESGVIIG